MNRSEWKAKLLSLPTSKYCAASEFVHNCLDALDSANEAGVNQLVARLNDTPLLAFNLGCIQAVWNHPRSPVRSFLILRHIDYPEPKMPEPAKSKRQSPKGYKFAVEWIANEDANGDDDPVDVLAGYISVSLAADIYGKTQEQVAQDVYNLRHPEAK